MGQTLDAVLLSWSFDPWLLAGLALTAVIYHRGWRALHRRDARRWHAGRLVAFMGGLSALVLALASPIEPFAGLLLQIHMLQHLLLMMVAPPLFWLGWPLFPLLRGLPIPVRTYWVGPLLRSPALRRAFGWITHPVPALVLFTSMTWLWHTPSIYDAALRSPALHYLQHICFLVSALVFWHPVVRPYPSRPAWSLWLLVPYLILADLQNTALSALLTFSDHVLYPYYTDVPRIGGLTALDDQSTAGVIMWVPGSAAFLLPLVGIGLRLLFGEDLETAGRRAVQRVVPPTRIALPVVAPAGAPSPAAGFDLLRIPVLGRFLRWRHARVSLQLPLLLLSVVVIFDGLSGPPAGPMNLAGVLPWIHWRGLIVLGLLATGNVFCFACPFMLPRAVARRWLPAGWSWPRQLRSKWLAVALVGAFLWAYEAFAIWDSPWWTAWIAVGYFVAALLIDGLFRGAAFCKYVCPIGQFNFVQSLASPLEVAVRDPTVCAACRTKDCIRGRDGIPGCELHLFQPLKAGNTDCTFCLDCAHACPHDNIGVLAGPPGRDLWRDPVRSGVGPFWRRTDLAALVVVLVFGAFANAAGMVGPVVAWQGWVTSQSGLHSSLPVVSAYYVLALLGVPLVTVGAAAAVSRWWGRLSAGRLAVATRFSFALVPLGFGLWLAHYSFHFLTSYDTFVPVIQRFAADRGWNALGEPAWVSGCCRSVADWLPRVEILFLDLGLLLSLYAAYRISLAHTPSLPRALKALVPWALLLVLLFALGVWIVLQPMRMRGTIEG
jgi:cytochrome c oxidase assembly factor CtaG